MRFAPSLLLAGTSALLMGAAPSRVPTAPHSRVQAASAPLSLGCHAGKDLIVQALEHLRANSSHDELGDADQLLRRALDLCSESGEAWYYRSLVEAKLGNARMSGIALDHAKMFPSEALHEGVNPFALAAPAAPAAPSAPAAIRQRWALVIGVGAFQDKSINALRFSTKDATWFRDMLLDPKAGSFPSDHVRLLTDEQATLRGIKEGINWLAREAGPDDLVVVYVASHGSSRDLDTAGANYIITHDTEVATTTDPDALYATALPMVDLSNAVATRFKARFAAVFLDTCYSGGAISKPERMLAPGVATAGVSRETLQHMGQGAGRIIIAAANTEQESLESEDLQHGYFTYFLVQTLRKQPADPLTKVFPAVQQAVSARVDKDYRLYNLHQTPVINTSTQATDFALGSGSGGSLASLHEGR